MVIFTPRLFPFSFHPSIHLFIYTSVYVLATSSAPPHPSPLFPPAIHTSTHPLVRPSIYTSIYLPAPPPPPAGLTFTCPSSYLAFVYHPTYSHSVDLLIHLSSLSSTLLVICPLLYLPSHPPANSSTHLPTRFSILLSTIHVSSTPPTHLYFFPNHPPVLCSIR